MRGELLGAQVCPTLAGAVDRVAKSLGEAIRGLSRPKKLETKSAFIDCTLSHTACAVELFSQTVPQSHGAFSGRFDATDRMGTTLVNPIYGPRHSRVAQCKKPPIREARRMLDLPTAIKQR